MSENSLNSDSIGGIVILYFDCSLDIEKLQNKNVTTKINGLIFIQIIHFLISLAIDL